MAEASVSEDQDQFSCSICLDPLKDPVTINCGHSYCMACINKHWDQKRVYSCPQCRKTFTPRPVLCRNIMLAEAIEKQKKASKQLQEKICSLHDKPLEIYCRTDQTFICLSCLMKEHKEHDTVEVGRERTEKQSELKEEQKKYKQRLQEKENKLQELKQAVDTVKHSAQSAVEDSERIFTELVEKKRSEVTELIRDQEKTELSAAEELLEQLEQEITDLKRRNTELEQLSHTEDHIHFLQSFQSLCVSSGGEDSPSITVHDLSFDGVRKSLSDLKERLEEFFKEEFNKISAQAEALEMIFPRKSKSREGSLQSAALPVTPSFLLEPKTKDEFHSYFSQLTLDPNTVHHSLILSDSNREVRWRGGRQRYPDHPERFDYRPQVLSKESLNARCYLEVEWSSGKMGWVSIAMSYKGISRKAGGNECGFGHNNQSWCLKCSSSLSFWHNNTETKISAPPSSRIGVYVDHSAGTLSFYSVSDTMTLLHTVHTTFTHLLNAGFGVSSGSSIKLIIVVGT